MLQNIFKKIAVEKESIIYLNVRLRSLDDKESYRNLTKKIIALIQEKFNPLTILVPAFTYSFTKTGIFDVANTPSEVGRFSEEARKLYGPSHRLVNPVFSLIDINKTFINTSYKYDTAFGENSIFDIVSKIGYYTININLDRAYIFLHHLEEKFQVPYRHHKNFQGILIDSNGEKEISYDYFVRDLNKKTNWKRNKIENILISNKIMSKFNYRGIIIRKLHSKQVEPFICNELKKDKEFLIRDKYYE